MPYFNKVFLMGHLGRDPELRQTKTDRPVVKFSLATSESWTDKEGNKQKKTNWHNIVIWDRKAEIANEFLSVGDLILLEGRLDYREYQDKDGQARSITEITVFNFQMIKTKKGTKEGKPPNNQQDSNEEEYEGANF